MKNHRNRGTMCLIVSMFSVDFLIVLRVRVWERFLPPCKRKVRQFGFASAGRRLFYGLHRQPLRVWLHRIWWLCEFPVLVERHRSVRSGLLSRVYVCIVGALCVSCCGARACFAGAGVLGSVGCGFRWRWRFVCANSYNATDFHVFWILASIVAVLRGSSLLPWRSRAARSAATRWPSFHRVGLREMGGTGRIP